ncbi:hypothetical protein GALMADRAFT_46687, partial [Galerina marginata CBS 339.88]
MIANVVMLSSPTAKVYHTLPPPVAEIDDVLAFVFMGSSAPTAEDFARTPLLVRRNKIAKALDWLKLNHVDYHDLTISQENLRQYPEWGIPVEVDFHRTNGESNKIPSAMSIDDNELEEGSESGPCPFTVNGLTGEEYSTMDTKAMKAIALRHLQAKGKVLGIGHDPLPQSMYNNPQAYPKMFPWLFPYGKGGIGQRHLKKKISEASQKKQLLMYYDK